MVLDPSILGLPVQTAILKSYDSMVKAPDVTFCQAVGCAWTLRISLKADTTSNFNLLDTSQMPATLADQYFHGRLVLVQCSRPRWPPLAFLVESGERI